MNTYYVPGTSLYAVHMNSFTPHGAFMSAVIVATYRGEA